MEKNWASVCVPALCLLSTGVRNENRTDAGTMAWKIKQIIKLSMMALYFVALVGKIGLALRRKKYTSFLGKRIEIGMAGVIKLVSLVG